MARSLTSFYRLSADGLEPAERGRLRDTVRAAVADDEGIDWKALLQNENVSQKSSFRISYLRASEAVLASVDATVQQMLAETPTSFARFP